MPISLPREDERLDVINENISLLQKKKGLTFGTDAFLLSAFCRPAPRAFAVDLGCGTGVVSLLLATKKKCHRIVGVEIQQAFAELAEKNIENCGFSDTVSVLAADLRDLTAIGLGRNADVVVANPPYMKNDCGYISPVAEKQIARHEVCGGIAEFSAAAGRILRYGGKFYVVYLAARVDDLFAALSAAKLTAKCMVFVQDTEKRPPSLVLVEARAGAAGGVKMLPTLVLREPDKDGALRLTARAAKIYETGNFSE